MPYSEMLLKEYLLMYYTVPNRVYSTLYGCYKLVFKSLFDTGMNYKDIKKSRNYF